MSDKQRQMNAEISRLGRAQFINPDITSTSYVLRESSSRLGRMSLRVLEKQVTFCVRGETFAVEAHDDPVHAVSSLWTFRDEIEIIDPYWKVKKGDVVLDVGAAFGGYTLPALAAGASMVYAVEPFNLCADALRRNVAINPGFAERCQVLDLALSDRTMRVRLSAELERHGAVLGDTVLPDEDTQFVTIDDNFRYLKRLDWVKMDTEGMEAEILSGGLSVLSRLKPRMILEDHTRAIPSTPPSYRVTVERLLREMGFEWHHVPFHRGPRDYWICFPAGEAP